MTDITRGPLCKGPGHPSMPQGPSGQIASSIRFLRDDDELHNPFTRLEGWHWGGGVTLRFPMKSSYLVTRNEPWKKNKIRMVTWKNESSINDRWNQDDGIQFLQAFIDLCGSGSFRCLVATKPFPVTWKNEPSWLVKKSKTPVMFMDVYEMMK